MPGSVGRSRLVGVWRVRRSSWKEASPAEATGPQCLRRLQAGVVRCRRGSDDASNDPSLD